MKLGLLHKPYTFRLQHYAVIAPVVFFRIKPQDALGLAHANATAGTNASVSLENVAPCEVLTENSQWPLAQKALGQDIFDMVMPKSHAEMLLAGTAWNPNRSADNAGTSGTFQVAMQLGNNQKVLNVFGQRHWQKGLLRYTTSPVQPVTSVPINDEHSFGGASHSINSLGKGYYPTRRDRKQQREQSELWLPSIEDPAQPVTSFKQHLAPAGLSSLAITHPLREQYNGDYTQTEWLEKHYPALAPDTDMRLFQAARPDQQFSHYLSGDETFALANVHPEAALISGRLPCVRPRAFVQFKPGDSATTLSKSPAFPHLPPFPHLQEVPLNLDTVWFFPEEEIGALVYHGQIAVTDVDAADIATAMLAYEGLAQPPRALHHYRYTLAERLDPELAPLVMADDSPLVPEKSAGELSAIAAEKEAEQAELAATQAAQQAALLAEIEAEHGNQLPAGFAIPEPEPLSEELAISQSDIDRGELNLKALKKAVDNLEADAQQQRDRLEAEHAEQQKKADALKDNIDPALKQEIETKTSLQDRIAPAIEAANSDAKTALDPEHQAQIEESQRQASRYQSTPFTDWPEDPQAQAKRAVFIAAWQQGEDLSKRDWTGCDLSGLDLTAVNLSQCQLENCNFENTILNHADLKHSGFVGAKLNGTLCHHANLVGCNFSSTVGHACQFNNADMRKTQFFKSSLSNCQWRHCDLQKSQFVEAWLPRANFSGSKLSQCHFLHTHLFDSDFTGASAQMMSALQCELSYSRWQQAVLSRCAFLECIMPVSNLAEVQFERCQFSVDVNLDGAHLSAAQLYQCGFRRISMNRVIAKQGYFIECDLGDSDLQFGQFNAAQFKRSVLSDSRCRYSSFQHSGLYQALLRKTDLKATELSHANFLEADCTLAVVEHSNYRDAVNVPDIAMRRWRDAERNAA